MCGALARGVGFTAVSVADLLYIRASKISIDVIQSVKSAEMMCQTML